MRKSYLAAVDSIHARQRDRNGAGRHNAKRHDEDEIRPRP